MNQAPRVSPDMEKRLAASLHKNTLLEDQLAKFRSIILKRGTSTIQAIPDSTIVDSFTDLMTQIQTITFTYYSNYPPMLLKTPRHRRCFSPCSIMDSQGHNAG